MDFSNDEWLEQRYPHLQKLKEFHAGDGFGEISLLTGGQRTGTVICSEDCDFLMIKKSTF